MKKLKMLLVGLATIMIASTGAVAQTTIKASAAPDIRDINVGPGAFISKDKMQELRGGLNILVTLPDGPTITCDTTRAAAFAVILGGNRTFTMGTKHDAGATTTLFLIQDGTGSRTVTWDALVHWPGGTPPTLTTTAGKVDVIQLKDTGTMWTASVVGLNY
jgi:hypothetical protein